MTGSQRSRRASLRVELLTRDLDEIAAAGTDPAVALARGARALGNRMLGARLDDPAREGRRLDDLADAYAHADADLRLVRFGFATRAPGYEEAARRHRTLTATVRALRTKRAPELAAELLELRASEETLERELLAAGLDPEAIAPPVPPEETTDLSYALLHLPRAARGARPPEPQRRRFRRRR